MEFPKNASTSATERVMRLFSNFSAHDKDHIVSLETGVYNRLYSLLYKEFRAIEHPGSAPSPAFEVGPAPTQEEEKS